MIIGEEEKVKIESIIKNNIEQTEKEYYKRYKQTYFDGKVKFTDWVKYKSETCKKSVHKEEIKDARIETGKIRKVKEEDESTITTIIELKRTVIEFNTGRVEYTPWRDFSKTKIRKRKISLLNLNENIILNKQPNLYISSYYKASYTVEAERLHSLNLFKGVSVKEFNPDLGSNLSREQATIILLRLIGQEQQAEKMDSTEVESVLASFSDANEISSWARKQVAYAKKEGIIKGFIGRKFHPSKNVTGEQYASLLLQRIESININNERALEKLASLKIISKEQKNTLNKDLLRDDVVYMTYKILNVKINNKKTLIENLIEKRLVEKELAEKYDLIEAKTPTQEPIFHQNF